MATGTSNVFDQTPNVFGPVGANDVDEPTRRILFGDGLATATTPNVVHPMIPSIPASASHGLMPDHFDGKGFKTWQLKMHFFLTNMKFDKFLKEDAPVLPEGNTCAYTLASVEAWIHGDFVCRGWILGRLNDQLYLVYSMEKSSKSLWMALEKKYKSEDAGCQKYAVAKFLDFKMVDSKPIMDQVEALQLICHDIAAEGMSICEIFTVNSFIEKLPPSWVDFKNYLKHKRKAMTLEEVITRLQMESRNRQANGLQFQEHNVNVATHKGKYKGVAVNKASPFKPSSSTNFKKRKNAETKFKGKCHKCNKIGHKSDVCRSKPKDNRIAQANLTEEDMCAVVSEVNMVEDNPKEWWYDTGATTHICAGREMFSTYQKSTSTEQLFMGNSAFSKI